MTDPSEQSTRTPPTTQEPDAEGSLDRAIDLATSSSLVCEHIEHMDDTERLAHLTEMAGQAVRDTYHGDHTVLATIASAAMQWAAEAAEGVDPPYWARTTALRQPEETQGQHLRRSSRLTLDIARIGLLLIRHPDREPTPSGELGDALITVAATALTWLATSIQEGGAAPGTGSPLAYRDPATRVGEEVLTALEHTAILRDADPTTMADLAEAVTDRLDQAGWLTPPPHHHAPRQRPS
ncbi:hypothetical protein [Actinomyces wuliandei]|uniref:hypothetical protein n=1 Tax=Actinomyces wuliandei TaxID=2057743 RepID=UPI00111AD48D|nr:hypothetical protein [Actinomyces wuliandei]